jgi:hypothetical protein
VPRLSIRVTHEVVGERDHACYCSRRSRESAHPRGYDSAESGEHVGQHVRLRMDLLTFDEAMVRLTLPHAVSLITGPRHVRIG